MTKNAVFLDVDPSIVEKNLKITEESPMERELNSLFESANRPKSKLVKPVPGFCVKTQTKPDNKKVFINICLLEDIPAPKDITADELMHILDSEEPSSYRVPMSIGEGRQEYDKKGSPVTCYDVAINPKFFKKITSDNLFQTFFLTVVFEGLQDKYQCEIHLENYVILQNKKAMGTLQTHRIEIRDIQNTEELLKPPLIEEISGMDKPKLTQETKVDKTSQKSQNSVPFQVYRLCEPEEEDSVIAEFKIPNNVRVEDLRLEVGEDRVVLQSGNSVTDFFIPFSIKQDQVIARLNRNNEILYVKLPTVH